MAKFCKMLYLCCFLAGFMIFLFMGKELLNDISLLNIDALKEIKNETLDKGAFFNYLLWRRVLILAAGMLFWWWNWGKWFLYGTIGVSAGSMGICMYICLVRYRLKGLFLWFFLYFPHILFYGAVVICAMMLSTRMIRERQEKIKFLLQKGRWVILLLIVFFLGIYMESYVNTALLQDYLDFF